MHEVRRHRAGQRAPLVVRLADEPHVTEPEVAQAAVDQLRGCARRPGAEVAGVEERDREPLARRVRGRRGADHAAADHEQVERRPGERLAGRRPGQSGFVHALRPYPSTTSTRANGAFSGRSRRAATISPSAVVSRISAPYR